MKKQFFFSMLAAAAMLASCGNEDAVVDNSTAADGEHYVSMAINLPTTPGTRAANDSYDDGLAVEYAVNDAMLVLFEGTTEANATVHSAYTLSTSWPNVGGNITATSQIVQKINGAPSASTEFFALVVLNNNSLLKEVGNVLKDKDDNVLTGKTFEWINTNCIVTDATDGVEDKFNTTSFFMANAPLATAVGGASDPSSAAVKTLVQVDKSKIYENKTDAMANPAATINVERAVAKVTMGGKADGAEHQTTENSIYYKVTGWMLDNLNQSSYLFRNLSATNFAAWKSLKSNQTTPAITKPYRFVGDNPVEAGLYRTYWGVDPNYNAADGTGMYYIDEDNSPTFATLFGSANPLYCAENTFDVDHQKDINTTTVIVKVAFKIGSGSYGDDFYTINNGETSAYTTAAAVITALKASLITDPVVIAATEATPDAAKLVLTLSTNTQGMVTVTDVKYNSVDKNTALKGHINNLFKIRLYDGGVAYYPVHIKHFGDDLTPWKVGETPLPTASAIYPATNKDGNYLGRYGVLRNNWYDISITDIAKIGSPTIPTLGTTPDPDDDPDGPGNGGFDDDIDQYISVRINILSWAKRTQNVTL